MKKAFTLIEMLVVIGIIVILTGVSISGFSKMRASAEKARAQELVSQTATSLSAIFTADGVWPQVIREHSEGDGLVDKKVAYQIAKRGMMSITYDADRKESTGLDRFGVVSPWATEALKKADKGASDSLAVGTDKSGRQRTVKDHTLRFKVDLDGDGIIENVAVSGSGGSTIRVRATAAVWCAGKDGKLEDYRDGLRSDDVYSWTSGQTRGVNQ